MKILIDTIPKVQKFVRISQGLRGNVTVVSGRYKVDGKSLLGIFSLNLSKPVEVEVNENDTEIADMVFSEFEV